MSPGRRGLLGRLPGTDPFRRIARGVRRAFCIGALAAASHGASAFEVNLTPSAPNMIYVQVGDGLFTGGNYTPIKNNGHSTGTPGVNTTINQVTVSVAPGVVGNGALHRKSANTNLKE